MLFEQPHELENLSLGLSVGIRRCECHLGADRLENCVRGRGNHELLDALVIDMGRSLVEKWYMLSAITPKCLQLIGHHVK